MPTLHVDELDLDQSPPRVGGHDQDPDFVNGVPVAAVVRRSDLGRDG